MSDAAAIEAECHEALRLQQGGAFGQAETRYRRALAAMPATPELHNNLGATLCALGRSGEAVASFRRAVSLQPGYAEAHVNLGMALLTQGASAEGWREYEWRWRMPAYARARSTLSAPRWHGEAPPKAGVGRLLLHAEQGAGDTLQFCRFAPLAAARGWRVTLSVPAPLVRLLRGVAGVAEVVEQDDTPPPHDRHCPLPSLPSALGLGVVPPQAAYVRADPALTAHWRGRLATATGGLRVGVAWAGSPLLPADSRRSLAPSLLAPLAGLGRVHLVSLQKGGAPAAGLGLIDHTVDLRDFADTAALVANLDLVVSVDSAVAHLAAAMGKPVWLLDRFDHCWRWVAGRLDSPWYPTLRIYRQARPGDWDGVIAAVARDLRRVCGAG